MTAEHVRLGLPEPELGKVLIGAYIDPPDRDPDDGRGESRAIGWKPVPSSELAGGGGGVSPIGDAFYCDTFGDDPTTPVAAGNPGGAHMVPGEAYWTTDDETWLTLDEFGNLVFAAGVYLVYLKPDFAKADGEASGMTGLVSWGLGTTSDSNNGFENLVQNQMDVLASGTFPSYPPQAPSLVNSTGDHALSVSVQNSTNRAIVPDMEVRVFRLSGPG